MGEKGQKELNGGECKPTGILWSLGVVIYELNTELPITEATRLGKHN
jgi:hypothetical protein